MSAYSNAPSPSRSFWTVTSPSTDATIRTIVPASTGVDHVARPNVPSGRGVVSDRRPLPGSAARNSQTYGVAVGRVTMPSILSNPSGVRVAPTTLCDRGSTSAVRFVFRTEVRPEPSTRPRSPGTPSHPRDMKGAADAMTRAVSNSYSGPPPFKVAASPSSAPTARTKACPASVVLNNWSKPGSRGDPLKKS